MSAACIRRIAQEAILFACAALRTLATPAQHMHAVDTSRHPRERSPAAS
jgi:hypothetical protein